MPHFKPSASIPKFCLHTVIYDSRPAITHSPSTYALVHPQFHPSLPGKSTCPLPYSTGTLPQTPLFTIAPRYNLPTTFPPLPTLPGSGPWPPASASLTLLPWLSRSRRASHAARMLMYMRSSSRDSDKRRWRRKRSQARWMVQWRRCRVRERWRGRGVRGWVRW